MLIQDILLTSLYLHGLFWTHTSAQHVFSLQQLDDGGLGGRDQDDAAVLSATHQSALRRDVHAGCHLQGETQTHTCHHNMRVEEQEEEASMNHTQHRREQKYRSPELAPLYEHFLYLIPILNILQTAR